MSPVFGHGRLRLYLLKLLDESPRHGYDVIRSLEDRFLGVYAPSAGTIYPRLARLEEEGLVTHDQEGGRKVYRLTDAGRAELTARMDELADLEQEIEHSVRDIAREVRKDVRDSVRGLREELKQATRDFRTEAPQSGDEPGGPSRDSWHEEREAWKRRKQAWREERRAWKDAWRGTRDDARRDFLDSSEAVLRDEAARRAAGEERATWYGEDSADVEDVTDRRDAGQREERRRTNAAHYGDPARREMEQLLQRFQEQARGLADQGYVDDDALHACRSILDNTLTTLRATLRPRE